LKRQGAKIAKIAKRRLAAVLAIAGARSLTAVPAIATPVIA
jgi:hypothetical protein